MYTTRFTLQEEIDIDIIQLMFYDQTLEYAIRGGRHYIMFQSDDKKTVKRSSRYQIHTRTRPTDDYIRNDSTIHVTDELVRKSMQLSDAYKREMPWIANTTLSDALTFIMERKHVSVQLPTRFEYIDEESEFDSIVEEMWLHSALAFKCPDVWWDIINQLAEDSPTLATFTGAIMIAECGRANANNHVDIDACDWKK